MSIRLKILSGFIILSCMLFAAGLLSIHELKHIGFSVQALLDENYKSINAAKNMIESLEREDSGVLLLLSGEWKNGRSTIQGADRDFQKAFEIARHNITILGEEEYITAIEKSYNSYKKLWIRPVVDTQREGDLSWYFNDVHPAFLNAKSAVDELMTLNDNTMYKTASELKNRAGRAIMPGIVAIVSALIFTAIFNFFINLYFILPIKRLAEGIQEYMKSGKMSEIRVESKDELSKLADSIRDLIIHASQAEKIK